ncbi:MAG: undecaprenyl diphosphate synthase family protein, partial [Saccharofermentanales bacterium]|jgi:undecaprenyl diphosphate synthase
MVHAARRAADAVAQGALDPEQLDERTFARYLYLPDVPPPDLMIRTGGERRLSNFLLWELAYTELYFEECLWPDFGAEELDRAIEDFTRRQRRFGDV